MTRSARGRNRRIPRAVGAMAWLILLLGSLSLVVWRQTRGAEMERELRGLEAERAVIETERVELARRIEELRSRSRVLRVARDRLGMHLPSDSEIVFLPVAGYTASSREGNR